MRHKRNPRQPRRHRGSHVVLLRAGMLRKRMGRFKTYADARDFVTRSSRQGLYILPDRLARNPRRRRYRRRRK